MLRQILIASLMTAPLSMAVAQTAPATRVWKQTAALPPGTALRIRLQDQPRPIDCSLVWIDLNALACETYDPRGTAHRVIYPALSVTSIKRRRTPDEADDHRRNQALLIGAAAGGLFGGLVGKNAGAGEGFALAGVGALVGAGIAAAHTTYGPPWQIFP